MKMQSLTLLMRYVEHYWTEFHQRFSIDAFWDTDDEHFNLRVKRSKVKVAASPRAQQVEEYRAQCNVSS